MSFFLSPYYLPALLLLAVFQTVLPRAWRPWLLLLTSIAAYGYITKIGILWLFVTTTLVSITVKNLTRKPTSWLSWSIPILLLLPLIIEKIDALFPTHIIATGVIFFPGMSFYLLQATGYVIDIKRGQATPASIKNILLSLSFFPSIFAGPILRTKDTANAFNTIEPPTSARADKAIRRILWGYCKKLVIADRITQILQIAWASPHSVGGIATVTTSILSYIQIYADYSGYIDIAIGSAVLLGIALPENFRRPYLASSLQDFWKRWNITLSGWLRDYIYIPLGGNRVAWPRWCVNILITFLISGAWHGGGTRFLLWGALHGAWMIGEAGIKKLFGKKAFPILSVLGWVATFTFVCATFVLFLSSNTRDTWTILTGIVRPDRSLVITNMFSTLNGKILLGGIVMLLLVEWIADWKRKENEQTLLVWTCTVLLALLISYFGMFAYHPFVYTTF